MSLRESLRERYLLGVGLIPWVERICNSRGKTQVAQQHGKTERQDGQRRGERERERERETDRQRQRQRQIEKPLGF